MPRPQADAILARPLRRILGAALGAATLAGVLAGCGGPGDDAGGPSGSGGSGPAVRPADEGIEGVLAIRIESADHTTGTVDYDRDPPAGGDHNPTPAPCGFYREQIPDEYVVHTLEHGAVWLAYRPDLPAADVDAIRAEVDANADTIATPDPRLPAGTPVVVTAWARQLSLPQVSDPRLDEFVQRYQNARTAPEASVACPRLADPG